MKTFALQQVGGMSSADETADAELIKRIAQRDRQALSELYMRYQRRLFTYLLQLTPDYGLAEEVLQDTMVAVWKSASSFEERSSVFTWLVGIARRQAHNTLRQHKIPSAELTELESFPATEMEPEEAMLASVAREELADALVKLAPLYREVLLLIFVQELSYHDTATALAIPVGTVKSRVSNARRALRAILDAKEDTGR